MTDKKPFDPSKPLKNVRYERFALAYIRHEGNGTQAYCEVYRRAADGTARAEASRLLTVPSISARVSHLRSVAYKREHMGAEETLALMARISRCDIGELVWKAGEQDAAGNQIAAERVGTRKLLHEMPVEFRRCVKSIKVREDGSWEFTLRDGDKHLTSIAQHHKLINSDMNVTVNVGFAERLREAREKRLKKT